MAEAGTRDGLCRRTRCSSDRVLSPTEKYLAEVCLTLLRLLSCVIWSELALHLIAGRTLFFAFQCPAWDLGHRAIASTMVYLKGVRNSDIQVRINKRSLAAFA